MSVSQQFSVLLYASRGWGLVCLVSFRDFLKPIVYVLGLMGFPAGWKVLTYLENICVLPMGPKIEVPMINPKSS